jgi:hypothetical protein
MGATGSRWMPRTGLACLGSFRPRHCCLAGETGHNGFVRTTTVGADFGCASSRGEQNLEAKPETTEQRRRPARKPYAAPTLVKRQKLGKIAAADTVISGTDTSDQ